MVLQKLQPDQDTARWDAHAPTYEAVFETLTNGFALQALHHLSPLQDTRLLDLCCGTGGAAIAAAQMGARVTAIDGAPGMIARLRARAPALSAIVQDGRALTLADGSFDAALSCFGIVLFPDPACGLAELYRVVRPGGRLAVVTWTEPHRYELSARLRAAGPVLPPGDLPAQLRYTDPAIFAALIAASGFTNIRIVRAESCLTAPSAKALAGSLAFAPGMAAMLDAFGPHKDETLSRFVRQLENDQGTGSVALSAVAHIAVAVRP